MIEGMNEGHSVRTRWREDTDEIYNFICINGVQILSAAYKYSM